MSTPTELRRQSFIARIRAAMEHLDEFDNESLAVILSGIPYDFDPHNQSEVPTTDHHEKDQ